MNPNPEPDKVLQEALNILREHLSSLPNYQANMPIQISVSAVLVSNNYSYSDAQRLYSGMKRLGLVVVIKTGQAYRMPTIVVDMTTTVEQRRLERNVSRKSHMRLTGIDAQIAHVKFEIAKAEANLKQLRNKEARLLSEKSSESQFQPTN